MAQSHKIVVVGDVHGEWDLQEDAKALHFLQGDKVYQWSIQPADLVLFTGDFSDENVELVRSIANLRIPKAVILGNHDCWYTQHFSEKRKDSVQLQLECLGEEHVGYSRLDFPMLKLSIVGGRPFSCGGEKIFRRSLVSARYGVSDMAGSAKKIYEAALGTPDGHSIIFLAHNGPTGLGSQISDICGKDWDLAGGDYGDPDLAHALSDLKKNTQLSIPLVVFGHMHKELAYGNGLRKMIVVGPDNTVYLNGAIVPRVKHPIGEQGPSSRNFVNDEALFPANGSHATLRAFTMIEISDGELEKIVECWISVSGDMAVLEEEYLLYKRGTVNPF